MARRRKILAGIAILGALTISGLTVQNADAAISEPHSAACLALGKKSYTYRGTTYVIPSTVLRQGSRGTCVYYLQELLMSHGMDLAVDGVFGSITKSNVLVIQKSAGLQPDGIVGNNTWSQLMIIG